MAGAGIALDLEISDAELVAAFESLEDITDRLGPAWQEIGDYLLDATEARFELAVSPDGEPWEPLDPAYQRRKRKNPDDILVLDGFLRDTIAFNFDPDGAGVTFGTNRVQAATHQFGREEDGIPQREFLGASDDDIEEIQEILADHLAPQ